MTSKALWKRRAVLGFGILSALVLAAYVFAWISRSSCEDAVYASIRNRGLHGVGLLGERIEIPRDSIGSRVAGPLQVEVHYFVPIDMHGIAYRERFLVLPGKRIVLNPEKHFPL